MGEFTPQIEIVEDEALQEQPTEEVEIEIEEEAVPSPLSEHFKNIAADMDEEKLSDLGSNVKTWYDSDLGSMDGWLKRYKEWVRLAYVEPKTKKKMTPWEGAANIVIPMLTTAIQQYAARAVDAIFSDKRIVKGKPIGKEFSDQTLAERVSTYMDYHLTYEDETFFEGMDQSLTSQALAGFVIRKTYYDERWKTVRSDFVNPNAIAVNYWTRYIEDAPRFTHVLQMTMDDIRRLQASGVFRDVELNGSGFTEVSEAREQSDTNVGQDQPENDDNVSTRNILEMHCWLDLEDNNKPTDPYVVFVDEESGEVLRIVTRINPNKQAPRNVINYFTKYDFFPSPDGSFFPMGFGLALENINVTANTIVNMLIDAGHLANTQGGFILKRSGMKRGNIQFDRGQFNEVDLKTDDIRKAIQTMTFKEPSNVLFTLLGALQEMADRVTSVSETMTGEMPRSGAGSTGVVSMLEQGLKLFKSIHKRNHRSFKKELQKVYDLFGIYLDEPKYVEIVVNKDNQQIPVGMSVTIEDFRQPLSVRPVSDPNIVSKSEVGAKAQAVYETIKTDQVAGQNPETVFRALESFLKVVANNETELNVILEPTRQQLNMVAKERELAAREQQLKAEVLAQIEIGIQSGVVDEDQYELAVQIAAGEIANQQVIAEMDALGIPRKKRQEVLLTPAG